MDARLTSNGLQIHWWIMLLSVSSDLRLPSQPQSLTVSWPVVSKLHYLMIEEDVCKRFAQSCYVTVNSFNGDLLIVAELISSGFILLLFNSK